MSAHHGNTPAAWTAVVVGLLGFTVGGVGLMFDPVKMAVFWVGVAITVAAGVVFVVMDRLGLGDHGATPPMAAARCASEPPATRGRRMLAPAADDRRPRARHAGPARPRPARARHAGASARARALGFSCPGCGGLRAVNDLTNGDVGAALSSNLLVTLMIPVAMVLLALWAVDRWRGRTGTCRGTGCGRR